MSEIICQWLNEELGLSRRVEPKSFAREFSTGYLIGEVLYKYQLQNDFSQFSQSRVSNSKLNNFTRVEPTLQLLGIPFDQNAAQNIMCEQHGAATRLLYQLYIALQRKKKAGLTGVALETLRPAAPAKLQSIGTEIYKDRIKTLVPRQSHINLQQVTEQFDLKAKEMDEKIAQIQNDELKKIQMIQQELRLQDIEKLRYARRKQNEIMARIQAAIVQIPKPPQNRTLKAIEAKKILKKKKEAEAVYNEISKFEKSVRKDGLSNNVTPNGRSPILQRIRSTGSIKSPLLHLHSADDYVRKIQKRLEEDTVAREQREKRRRRILMDQLIAHESQEEAFQEEQLITRLMRQSQQERRIAVQLMQARHEKEVLQQNRIFREKQYEERREREFQDALDREAALQKQARLDHEEQMRKILELYDQLSAERAEARYKKHYYICQGIMSQIVDLVTKIGEYRELTDRLIPNTLMREWKEIYFTGLPLYEEALIDPLPSEPTPEQLVELEKESLLDEKEYEEYKNMSGDWISSDDVGVKAPAANNNILGHVVHRLLEIVDPTPAPTPPPVFPPFPIKGCVLGKIYSGKSTCLRHLAQAYSTRVLSVDTLVQDSIQAYQEARMSTTDQKEADENTLSAQAHLGMMAEKHLKRGKAVPDELLVDILVEAINCVPANTGWIMDGFPATLNQAKLLEKALTGADSEKMAARSKKSKTSHLLRDSGAPQDPPPQSPAFDFAVLIDVSDNVVLQRAAGLYGGVNPLMTQGDDPDNAAVGDHDQTIHQIQHRITGFLDSWHKLEMWFSVQQNILVKVDGEVAEDILCKEIEQVFLTTVYNKENKGKETEKKEEIPPPPPVIPSPPPPAPSPPPPPDSTKDLQRPPQDKQASAKKGRKQSQSPKDTSVDKKEKKDTPRGKDSESRTPKSGSPRGRSPGKKSKSATPEPPVPTPVGPPPIQPGSAEWVYVSEPLPPEIPEFLVPYWQTIEKTYVTAIKAGLRSMRKERFIVIHYLYDIRGKFKHYLQRPDHKQEFVSQWQSDFSSVPEDMWEDEETKAEWHQRLDDLRDRLWDICDNRKEEAEQERSDIMNEGWLQDHLGILMNHCFSLMQVEVDRFQDTVRFLHDYYEGMEKRVPSESRQEFARIPLLDISYSSHPEEPDKPKRIPLVPRRHQSPEPNPGKQKGKPATLKGKEDPSVEYKGQIPEADQKLIHDTWQTALSAVTAMLAHEKLTLEAEDEKEQQLMEMKEKERAKGSQTASRGSEKGAKKKPPKSPNRKKGGKSPGPVAPTPTPTASEDNTELQRQQELRMKMKQEYCAALECEEASVISRLELIKVKAIEVCQEIAAKSEQAYKDMDKWLGLRFLAEMSSIDKLIQIARHHIETSTKIQYELVLEQTDFYINTDVKVIPDPEPPPVPPAVETSPNGALTISQLRRLHQQFLQVAPDGLISIKLFTDFLTDLTSMNVGDDALPESWMRLTLPEIQEITSALSESSDVVNWRKFLLSVSVPCSYPSLLQLLTMLERFREADPSGCGRVTEECYSTVELWFMGIMEENVPENPTEPPPFNRMEHLIRFYFDMFADYDLQPPQLDYIDMLLYFASHPDPMDGFYRALSVTTGKPITKQAYDGTLVKSLPTMDPLEEGPEGITEQEKDIVRNTEPVAVTLQEVLRVFQHGAGVDGENHRFQPQQKETTNYQKIIGHIFSEMSPDCMAPVSLAALLKHPIFHDLVENCHLYKLSDIQVILQKAKVMHSGEGDTLTSSSSGT
ncbi:sperm flagellar protein 2 isoform X2 [Pseudophryne corroboree]|uniref:sperm flagellar protein 2 isoform X2 n=1 Tax=Pseudophryne corroboree TaxID=495146 RepID=UPI003081B05B